MRSYIASSVLLFAALAFLVALKALFAAWWDLADEDSLLPLFAAAGVMLVPILVLRRGAPRLFDRDKEWSESHIVAVAAGLGAGFFLFLLAWGVLVQEAWSMNLAWSAGGAVAMFVGLVVIGWVERFIRRREARKRGIAPEDYKPGKLARRTGSALAVRLGVYLVLGLLFELSDTFA